MIKAAKTVRTLRRRTVLAMAVSAISLAGVARAYPVPDLIDLQIVDRETGQPLRVWRHDGRLFVAGQPGARYSLRVTNHSQGRVLVVMSVDGVNILTGETAAYGQRGYVISPYETHDITGWRKSETEVAAFAFAPLAKSYAARTGRPFDVGVIGIAAFKERVAPPMPAPAYEPQADSRGRYDPETSESVVSGQRVPSPSLESRAPAAAPKSVADSAFLAERRTEKLGTAHGAREWSTATLVTFQRATSNPQFVQRIEYDTYANLVASGVIRRSWDHPRPQPFPSNGYVPDPPGGR